MGLDRTYHAHKFIFSVFFYILIDNQSLSTSLSYVELSILCRSRVFQSRVFHSCHYGAAFSSLTFSVLAFSAPLQPPLFILNLTTVTLSITTFQTANLTGSNRFKTFLLALLSRLLNPHISLPFSNLSNLHWLKVNERIELLSFIKFLQPVYLHNLIFLQPRRSTRSSSVVTLSRPPIVSSLKITDRSFRYASSRFWNQHPDSFRLPSHSCLDSPPLSLVNPSCHHLHSQHPSLLHFFTPG